MQSPLQMFQKAFPISYFAKEDSSYAFCNNSKYHAVSSKNQPKTCRIAVVGAERSIQLSYDRLCMKNAVTAYFNLVK